MLSIFMNKGLFLAMLMVSPSFVAESVENENGKGFPFDCETSNNTFIQGEELTYRLYYNLDFIWIKAGEVKFKVEETEDRYVYTIFGDTYKSYEWFYKVHDEYRTEVDKSTLLPIFAERTLREGGYRLYEYVVFDHTTGKAEVTRGRTKEDATYRGKFDIDCTHDLVGLLYGLRNMDKTILDEHRVIPIDFFLDMKTYDLNLHYQKQEVKKVRGLGKFNAVRFSPEIITGGVFKDGDQMQVWVSDDENKVPLLIQSPVVVGSVKAVLRDHKSLKYDLSSKL